ncbi:MAG TPA: hypothetical protein VGS58_08235 [Candidatus Sulfopaludibacter sp.]|nr:hypothetical protein [Candidatus Sulfopaludibacter sp.]
MTWRSKRERELDEEIAAHLAMAARDMGSPSAARKDFGSEALVKEATRADCAAAYSNTLSPVRHDR